LKVSGDNVKVTTAFSTHYHLDHTRNNEYLTEFGAKIIAHDVTRQWMSTDYWVPAEERYEKARPKAAWPTETFFNTGSMKACGEQIDYGYLVSAHTNGDMYVHFKDSNVLVVGDVASPVRRIRNWIRITGPGWIGGRVDAMDLLLKISNARRNLFRAPAGNVASRVQAEREVMEVVRQRVFKRGPGGRRSPGYVGSGRDERSQREPGRIPTSSCTPRAKVAGETITSWTRVLSSVPTLIQCWRIE
jgi:hypothetical protein